LIVSRSKVFDIMNQRTLDVLEYARIRGEISGFCLSEEGKSSFIDRVPSPDATEVSRLKTIAGAWMRALSSETPPAFRAWPVIRPFLSRLPVEGASLVIEEVYALGLFADSVSGLRSWASLREAQVSSGKRDSLSVAPAGGFIGGSSAVPTSADAPLVAEALALADLSPLSNEVFKIVDRNGELRDLPELRAIRQEIRKIRQDIERLVGNYLSDETLKTALQSTLPTVRDGRQVIALRSNFKGRVRGIVHEVSQSGQTVYVEPEDVIDRNNDLVTEEHRLSREVARILRELTARIAPLHGDIVSSLDRMVFLDGMGAVARWGAVNRCVFAHDRDPSGDDERAVIQLRQARHPLLRERAVPIDLVFVPGGRVLIITGPNTGGKTVSLKTVALFSLLNQSGWPIPATEPTVLPIFDYVGCDIGDEQSLDQSLSTFSGHMKNIAGILESATGQSLVLLDELGSGTDPQEGSAIAMAVLDELLARGSTVLVTTHHGILKNYGYTHESCINASVDFDQDTLSPTYRILMGIPGESHALDIASRNGLDRAIVAGARSYLQEERADVSALIKGLTAKHEELDRFEQEKKAEEQTLREKRRKSDLKELQLRQKEVELREQGYRRLERLFEDSRKQLENLVRELREGELSREKTVQMKNWIADFESRVSSEYDGLRAEREDTQTLRRELDERIRAEDAAEDALAASGSAAGSARGKGGKGSARSAQGASQRASPRGGQSDKAQYVPDFAPGVDVYIGEAKRRGTLVREAKKGQWIVAAGTLKMTVKEAELSAVPVQGSGRKVSVEVQADMDGADTPAFELRLLGMRHDEAMKALERQLDLAAMKGLKEFSIVHGKGHGILQQAVHEMLSHYAGVGDFHFARPEDGGTGKTIVTLS
jgi:DNA mismatch repair protein MutS2